MGIFDFLHKNKTPVDPNAPSSVTSAPDSSASAAPQSAASADPNAPVISMPPTPDTSGVDPGPQPPTPAA